MTQRNNFTGGVEISKIKNAGSALPDPALLKIFYGLI